MKFKTYALVALFVGALALIAPEAFADVSVNATQNVGDSLLTTATGFMSGKLALFIGLIIAAFGLWTWIMSQNTWGVMLIVFGIVLTAFPSMFSGMAGGSQAILGDLFNDEKGFIDTRQEDATK